MTPEELKQYHKQMRLERKRKLQDHMHEEASENKVKPKDMTAEQKKEYLRIKKQEFRSKKSEEKRNAENKKEKLRKDQKRANTELRQMENEMNRERKIEAKKNNPLKLIAAKVDQANFKESYTFLINLISL